MSLFEYFSCFTRLPVKINDVRDQILSTGVVSSIEFFLRPLPQTGPAGFVRTFTLDPPYGPSTDHAQIFCDSNLDRPARRLVLCKELLHILDNDTDAAQSKASVSALIDEMRLPATLAASVPGKSDQFAPLLALAILLPRDALHHLRPLVASNRIATSDVARIAGIPAAYAEFVLSPLWEACVEAIGDQSSRLRWSTSR